MAEFVAGSGTATGLAWRIIESGNRLEIATMFAALALLALLGVAIFAALSLLEWLLLQALARKRAQRRLTGALSGIATMPIRPSSTAPLMIPGRRQRRAGDIDQPGDDELRRAAESRRSPAHR